MTFGEMLEEKKISQSDCARELGISRQLVSMIVKGVREPSDKLKGKIKDKYGYDFPKKISVVPTSSEVINAFGCLWEGRDRIVWEKGVKDACEFYGGK